MQNNTEKPSRNYLVKPIKMAILLIAHTILLILFIGVVTPAGYIMRLLGNDPLHRKWKSTTDSYYYPSKERTGNHMDNPF